MTTKAPINLDAVRQEKFAVAAHTDLLVIGGGVNGLAVAWSAALSGLSVTVVDKGDWGSGTSSWSSRLIHGGLKYLEKLDVALVRESLADREWLLKAAPHLVKPMPFLLPFVRGNQFPKFILRLGMIVYDILSFDKSLPWHKNFSRQQVISRWPGVREDGLAGGSVYYDAQVADSERLCIELMLAARDAGANTINHAKVSQLLIDNNRVMGAEVVDVLDGHTHTIRADLTVNLSGAWLDSVFEDTPLGEKKWIGGTKGTHLIIRRPGPPLPSSVYFESDDARPMMVIPWKDMVLIGSTDKRFEGDIDTMSADQEEIDYILYETNKMFPAWTLTEEDVHYWYTGLRPLPYVSASRTADITRRHKVHTHQGVVSGLISVTGGKLTTFRALSGHVMKAVAKRLRVTPVSIGSQRFPGAVTSMSRAESFTHTPRQVELYGGLTSRLDELMGDDSSLSQELDAVSGVTRAEVVNAVVHEEAATVADVVARRTVIGLNADLGLSGVDAVADEMAQLLGWSAAQKQASIADYHRYIERFTKKASPVEESDAVTA